MDDTRLMLANQPHADGPQPGVFDLTESNARAAEKKDNEGNEELNRERSQDDGIDHDQIRADEDGHVSVCHEHKHADQLSDGEP